MSAGETTIGTRTARAALWSLIATTATRFIAFGSLIILARLLAPRDFGLLSFALVYITYIETIGDLGTGLALIYWPDRIEDAAQVTFWTNLVAGVFWFVLTLSLAPAIASFFNSPEATSIVRLFAWSFPLKYLGNTHDALAQKQMRFRARLVPELGMSLGKAGVAVAFASAGFGALSMVYGHLAGQALWTGLQWLATPWRPTLRFPRDLAGPMLRYGRGMVAVNLIGAVSHHSDFAVVGRMLGASALGVYQMASRVPEMSVTILMWVASRVLFPVFAHVHAAGKNLKSAYLAAVKFVSLLTVPAAIGLAVTAEPVILFFFGEKWRPSIPALRVLALYSGLRCMGAPATDVMRATGKSRTLVRLGIVKAVILLPAIILAARYDVVAVAIAFAAVTFLTLILNLGIAAVPLKVTTRDLFSALRVSLTGGAAMAIVVVILERFLTLTPGKELFILTLMGALTYGVTVRILDPGVYGAILNRLFRPRPVAAFRRVGKFLVPRGARPIRRYFLKNLYVTPQARERLLRTIAPARLPRGESADLAEVIPLDGLQLIREMYGDPSSQAIVMTDHAGTPRSKTVVFLFKDQGVPAAVVKLRPVGTMGAPLENEWKALKLAREFPQEVRSAIPEALAYVQSGRFEGLVRSHMPGRSAYRDIYGFRPSRHLDRHFLAAAAWLAAFQNATRAGAHTAVHGDFWPRNLLYTNGVVSGVIDWEHFSPSGSPFTDLFHFPLTYGLAYPPRISPLEAFHRTFIADTPLSRAVRRYLERYVEATGTGLDKCREGFEIYLLARGSDEKLPWRECLRMLQNATRSVFSG